MKKLFTIALLCLCTLAIGQTKEDPIRLYLGVTTNKLDMTYFESMFNFSDIENVGFRVGADAYLNPSLDASFNISRGKMKHEDLFFALITDVSARLTYKFNNGYIMEEDARVAPFLGLGFGITNMQDQESFWAELDGTHAMIPFAAGVNFKLNKKTDLVVSGTYNKTLDDTYNYLQYGVGVKFSMQRDKDRDGDGVLDRDDACPDVAGPVNNYGCPLADDDNDGVPNNLDACPQVAGAINGCPDTDGDSVPDIYDACPTVAGDASLGGCPDSDNDGVVDSQDPCPNTYGTINGCTQEAMAAMLPDSEEVIRVKLIEAAENILFKLNKSSLTAGSREPLNDILTILKDNPAMKLDINGHADSQGSATYNYELSRDRANTIKQWFIKKGISASRLQSEGFGERAPRATNDTAAGRALNRRVDIDFIIKK